MKEANVINSERKYSDYSMREAIVIGSGIGGLLASTTLCENNYKVTCIDADVSEERTAIHQRHHTHSCMGFFCKWLDKHYPQFGAKFAKLQGSKLNWGEEITNVTDGYTLSKFTDPNINSYFGTRNAIELAIKQCLLEQFGDVFDLKLGVRIRTLLWKNQKIVGVKSKNGTYNADLIIDCRGANAVPFSDLPEYRIKDTMETKIYYYSREYEGSTVLPDLSKAYMSRRTKLDMFYIFPIGEKRWLLTMGGNYQGNPSDMLKNGYYQEGRLMIDSMVAVTDWSRGHQKKWWLSIRNPVDNFIEFGDRNLRVVPIYGTGMTMCAKQADALSDCLKMENPSLYFPQRIHADLKRAWIQYQGLNPMTNYQGSVIEAPNWRSRLFMPIKPMLMSGAMYYPELSNIMVGIGNYQNEYMIKFNQNKCKYIMYGVYFFLMCFAFKIASFFRLTQPM